MRIIFEFLRYNIKQLDSKNTVSHSVTPKCMLYVVCVVYALNLMIWQLANQTFTEVEKFALRHSAWQVYLLQITSDKILNFHQLLLAIISHSPITDQRQQTGIHPTTVTLTHHRMEPTLQKIELIKNIQHRFTKMIKNMEGKLYNDRLKYSGLWILEERTNRVQESTNVYVSRFQICSAAISAKNIIKTGQRLTE